MKLRDRKLAARAIMERPLQAAVGNRTAKRHTSLPIYRALIVSERYIANVQRTNTAGPLGERDLGQIYERIMDVIAQHSKSTRLFPAAGQCRRLEPGFRRNDFHRTRLEDQAPI